MDVRRLAAAALVIAGVVPAGAQDGSDFSAIVLSVGGAAQTAVVYDDQWDTGPGATLRAATPYRGGHGFMALRAYPNWRRPEHLADFLAVHATVGWGPEVRLPAGITLVPSPHLGAVAFRFDDEDDFTGALRNETEVTAGVAARLDVPIAGPVHAWIGADAQRVFTTPRTDMLFVEAGLGISLASPGWLRRGLR